MNDRTENKATETLRTRTKPRVGIWTKLWGRIENYFVYELMEEDDFFEKVRRYYHNENMSLTKKDK